MMKKLAKILRNSWVILLLWQWFFFTGIAVGNSHTNGWVKLVIGLIWFGMFVLWGFMKQKNAFGEKE